MCEDGVMTEASRRLQERKRQAVRTEIIHAAERLFLERGYEATTVEDIATEAGLSLRSVYRYFPTKDDLLVGRFAESLNALIHTLATRPATEPPWQSLQAAFDPLVQHADGQLNRDSTRRVHQAIYATPSLLGRYLQQLHDAQLSARDTLQARSGTTDSSAATGDGALLAVVGSAFACFVAAQETWSHSTGSTSFKTTLDQAMAAVTPT